MHDAYKVWGITALVIFCVSFFFPPCANFLGPLLLINPTKVTLEANKVLQSHTFYEIPEWINDCSREDQLINMDQVNTDNIENTVNKINALAKCLMAYHILAAITLVCLLYLGCAHVYRENHQ